VKNSAAPSSPRLAAIPRKVVVNCGSSNTLNASLSLMNRPGAPRISKRRSTPTRNSGGPIQAWMEPCWVPSICRAMAPSWLAGYSSGLIRPRVFLSMATAKRFIHSCCASLSVAVLIRIVIG
jgi:hypothetical protein